MLNIFYFSALELGKPDAANEHTFKIATGLAKRGHKVTLFIPSSKNAQPSLPEGMRIVQSPVVGEQVSILFTITFYLLLPWSALKHFWHSKPDIIYTRFSFFDFLAIFPLKLFFRFTYITEVNGIRSMESQGGHWNRWFIQQLEALSLRFCDYAIGVTPELCQWIIKSSKLPANRVETIGNGVDTELFSPMLIQQACQMLGLDPQIIYINFTGTLKPWHGPQVIVKALPEIISNADRRIEALFIGDGPEKPSLVELADRLGVSEVIHWIGRVPRNLVPLYINVSAICLAPVSPGERTQIGLSPLKVFEYMSCAKPIITNRINTHYDEMIASGPYGILVEPNNPSALAQAVLDLLKHPELAEEIGLRNRHAALENYSWDHIAEQTEKFLLDGQKREGKA